MMAHRAVWKITNGPIPEGQWVLHHCDVAACVRISHLYLGNHEDNTRDCVSRGRNHGAQPGEEHHGARLTWVGVEDIRQQYSNGELQRTLASKYGVSQMTISKVVRNETWTVRGGDRVERNNLNAIDGTVDQGDTLVLDTLRQALHV